jgi:hypothetical protein
MPPQGTLLGSIFRNWQKGQEISPYMRGQVAKKSFKGYNMRGISKDLDLYYIIILYNTHFIKTNLRNNSHSLPQKLKGKLYTNADKRVLLRHVYFNPKDMYN